MKISAIAIFGLAASASAFAPEHPSVARQNVVLEMANEKRSKRKAALKTVGKVAGAFGTIALGTSAIPGAASAAKAVKAAETTKDVAEGAGALKTVGTLVAGGAIALIGQGLFSGGGETVDSACVNKIGAVFPGALANKDLVAKVSDSLEKYGYGSSSLVATSLCADEVNRPLERDFSAVYDENFSMGGLAGFPFGGVTSFGAMAAHIPDGGSFWLYLDLTLVLTLLELLELWNAVDVPMADPAVVPLSLHQVMSQV